MSRSKKSVGGKAVTVRVHTFDRLFSVTENKTLFAALEVNDVRIGFDAVEGKVVVEKGYALLPEYPEPYTRPNPKYQRIELDVD